eukprot:m.733684 g.733684  ORF g.733684 m.733684 type:complete len:846 (+) comp23074_c0_seq1:615-3152(+)
MWWWDWSRWEREIDWMALWGVNLVLAYTGQEQVFRKVFNNIGVNDTILNKTFDGPAFLTWSRGQGTFGEGGPLPNFWIESQRALQIKIMDRLRLLGMSAIVPGFQGNVPVAMHDIFPHANTSNGWLDALDPLFTTIARGVADGIKQEFGPSEFLEADGWFSLETGPWLGSMSEMHSQSAVMHGDNNTSQGSCLGGFVIPSEEEAYTRAQSVFASLTLAEPNATWVYQGYPWFRVYSQGSACNQSALRAFVRGFTRGIPKDKLLVLDLIADYPNNGALWRYPADPVLGAFTQNATLIWCALNNWGGAVHLGGDLAYALDEARAAMATARTAGVGLTPEGIDSSPAYFSLVLDAPWTPHPTAASWLQEWGASRCGSRGVAAAQHAYALLFQTVYRPGKPYLWCCSKPKFCPTVLPGDGSVARPDYNTTLLRQALELMVEAAPECDTNAFKYDLVDVAREWLSMQPCLDRLDKINPNAAPADLKARVKALLDVTADVDAMLATDPGGGFLLGAWLKRSRDVSTWDGSNGALADFYEWNSRLQISTWAGGYSRREWSGMVNQYYGGRVNVWLNYTLGAAPSGVRRGMNRSHPLHDLPAVSMQSTANGYDVFLNKDCNFDDIRKATCPSNATTPADCVRWLEDTCNNTVNCIGFNYPGQYLKSSCTAFISTPNGSSTLYLQHADVPPQASGYYAFPGWDCNFGDLEKIVCPTADKRHCLQYVEAQCTQRADCIAFNYPGEILKKNCDSFIKVPGGGSTVYIKHPDVPPTVPRSSCIDGLCTTVVGDNGTFIGADCDGTCPVKPRPSLQSALAAFADAWVNETWSEARLPSSPVGDPVALAKRMLAKYPAL